MLERPSFGSSFKLQPATYNIARYDIVPDSIKHYMAVLGTLNVTVDPRFKGLGL